MKRHQVYTFLLMVSTFVGAHDDFIKSFVACYDMFPQGRYSRGYPDYLAKKSQTSLQQLEERLRREHFSIDGRYVLSGYEQNAVPSYIFTLEQNNIQDEASIKGNSGWSFAPGNMFGFTTGFLFKDCNSFPQNTIFKHIGHERVEIFSDDSVILQRNAFGGSYRKINESKYELEKLMVQGKAHEVLSYLVSYWQDIYAKEKNSHDFSIVATQDILFSILYATYLAQSPVAIKQFFTGPDITYPIRVLPIQPLEATRNAQDFLQTFVHSLKPVDNEPTAYIFCSFVDGVGKSTLLGNIINWLKFGTDFERYEAVNNSSSQLATLYPFAENTYIVDLPAQISHYCAKPDGYVFVDIESCSLSPALMQALSAQIASAESLNAHVEQFLIDMNALMQGSFKQEGKNTFYVRYLKNIHRLGAPLRWLPLLVEEQLFVLNMEEQKIRMLVPFDTAHSTGLKVREPELMLFEGAAMPMRYEVFLDDLTKRMHEQGIKHVYFVDFISMYPRSSRENVRINFMMQQLKALFGTKFSVDKSFYRDFSNNYELYPLLGDAKNELINNMALEILSRTSLNDCIVHDAADSVNLIKFDDLIALMQKKLASMSKKEIDDVYAMVRSKLEGEFKEIEYFKYAKVIESCWHTPLTSIAALSEAMRDLFAYKLPHPVVGTEWASLDSIVGIKQGIAQFASGAQAQIVLILDEHNHTQQDWEKLTSLLRVTYYGTILDLLTRNTIDKTCPPVLVVEHEGQFLVLQKHMKDYSLPLEKCVSIKPYMREYSYGLDLETASRESEIFLLIKGEYTQDERLMGDDFFIPISAYMREFDKWNYWSYIAPSAPQMSALANDPEFVGLSVRALATVDCLVKHPKMEIMACAQSREDFIASLRMIEFLWLKQFVGLVAHKSVFGSYYDVEPLVKLPWKEE